MVVIYFALQIAVLAVAVCLAIYTHWAIGRVVINPLRRWGLRLLLLVVGAVLGWLVVEIADVAGFEEMLAVAMVFSLAHLPAALVVAVRQWRMRR